MAVPERRMSRSDTRSRRARWKAVPVQLVPVQVDGVRTPVPRYLEAAERGLLR